MASNREPNFENWGKTQSATNVTKFTPYTLEEVKQVVNKASNECHKIRCVGSAHSWSPIFPDDNEYLVDMSKYHEGESDRIKFIYSYNEFGEPSYKKPPVSGGFLPTPCGVMVLPSVTTGELADALLERGLALPCNVILKNVTYGGVIATACHGVGKGLNAVSDYVTYLETVCARTQGNAEVVKFVDVDNEPQNPPDDIDMKNIKAAQGNLGLLGIVVSMALKVQNTVLVKETNEFGATMEQFFKDESSNKLKDLVDKNFSVELFWFPFNSANTLNELTNMSTWDAYQDEIWIRMVNVAEGDPKSETVLEKAKDAFTDDFRAKLFSCISPLLINAPVLTPFYLSFTYQMLKKQHEGENATTYCNLPDAIHFQSGVSLIPVYDMEFAFKIEKNNFSSIIKAVQAVVDTVIEYKEEKKYPLNMTMEMRFMGKSEVLLCPANQPSTCTTNADDDYGIFYLEVLALAAKRNESPYAHEWQDFINDVALKWTDVTDLKPIPHWAKQWPKEAKLETSKGTIYEYVKEVFGPRITQFQDVMETYDPQRIFVNEALGKIFPARSKKTQECSS